MATNTTRLGLRKPNPDPLTGDYVDVEADLNDNYDAIDGFMPFHLCTSGTRPASPYSGMQIYETDTGNCLFWNGTGWKRLMAGSQATRWPDELAVERALSSQYILKGSVTTDANDRVAIRSDGLMVWGAGGASTGDTNLYRSAADTLKTDDAFVAVGSITGSQFLPSIAAGYMYSQTVNFTASGSFAKASYPGIRGVIVEVQGGGGGGGGTSATGAGTVAAAGGGGGGGYMKVFIPASTLGTSETVTIGAFGAGGAAGANTGANGGDTTFGTYATGSAGTGGEGITATSASVASNAGDGGAASYAGTGVVPLMRRTGSNGHAGMQKGTTVGSAGRGGDAFEGPGGRQSVANSGGNGVAPAANTYGGGGSGAWADVSQAAFAGGNGAAGICFVHVLI